MTEESATILENTAEEPKTPENPPPQPENPPQPEPPAQSETSKRGRPAGSKDRVPRRKIKIEPFPEPVEMTPPRATSAPPKAPPKAPPRALPKEVLAPPRERTPSPPTPRTLYRQTSEHLINLRDIMNQQKRTAAAERYTSNLPSWMA